VDLLFVDAMKTIADEEAVASEVPGPLMIRIVVGSVDELEQRHFER